MDLTYTRKLIIHIQTILTQKSDTVSSIDLYSCCRVCNVALSFAVASKEVYLLKDIFLNNN